VNDKLLFENWREYIKQGVEDFLPHGTVRSVDVIGSSALSPEEQAQQDMEKRGYVQTERDIDVEVQIAGITPEESEEWAFSEEAQRLEDEDNYDVQLRIVENWRKFIKEETWADYGHDKGSWEEIPVSDLKHDPENVDITDELYALIANAYKEIGGNFDYKSAADIPKGQGDDSADYWSAIDLDDDPEPDALRVGKSKPSGLKLSASGHDGKRPSINAYKAKTADMLHTPGTYAEMSKGIAHVMLTYHDAPYVGDPDVVQRVLGASKPINWLGPHPAGKYPGIDGWYTRTIKGNEGELKIMLGSPNP
jgi:hypothetical protein